MPTDIYACEGRFVRIQRSKCHGRERIDVREYSTGPNFRSLEPTQEAVVLRLAHLPRLLAALYKVESELICEGLLHAEDYMEAGLAVPDVLKW